MQKLILMSLIVATFAIPTLLRRAESAKDGFRVIVKPFGGFVAIYVFLLLYVDPRLH